MADDTRDRGGRQCTPVRAYTVFAEVVEGIGVVDGIREGDAVAAMRMEPARRGLSSPGTGWRGAPMRWRCG